MEAKEKAPDLGRQESMSKENLFSDVVMPTVSISAREVKAKPNDSGLASRGCTSNKWVKWGLQVAYHGVGSGLVTAARC